MTPVAHGVRDLMSAVAERYDFVGAVAVMQQGETVYEDGWGFANRAARFPFGPDTAVDAGSLAKTFVAASLWQLTSEGRLDLDAPVHDLVPEVVDRSITILDLMRHAGGLREIDDPTGMTNAEIARAVGAKTEFPPGSRARYSNEGFDVLALLIERLTGQHWSQFLADRFFTPFGLRSAFIRPARLDDWRGVRTASYRRTADGDVLFDMTDDEPFYGSSNIMMSVGDLTRWGHAFASGSVLSGATLQRGRHQARFSSGEVASLNDLNWYQLSEEGPAYFDGHVRGFHSALYWDPTSQLVVAWASNTLGARPDEFLLTNELARVASGAEPADVSTLAPFEGASPAGSALTGRYRVPGVGVVDITERGGILGASVDGGPIHDGYPIGGFYSPDLGAELRFHEPTHGRCPGLQWISAFGVVDGVRLAATVDLDQSSAAD